MIMKQSSAVVISVDVIVAILLLASKSVTAQKSTDGENYLLPSGGVDGTLGSNKRHIEDMKATLTLRNFTVVRGAKRTACDNRYYPDIRNVVGLATEWYEEGSKCGKNIVIVGNGRSVIARVVDECKLVDGCKKKSIGASAGVWLALRVHRKNLLYGEMEVTWSDA